MGTNLIQGIDGRVLGGVSAGLYRVSPWHGLGNITDSKGQVIGTKNPLTDDLRTAEFIRTPAGLDWEPEEFSLDGLLIESYDSDGMIDGAHTITSQRKMLIRRDFPHAGQAYDLGVHSDKYGTLSNETGLSFVEEILKHRSDAKLRSVTTLYGGRIVFAVIEFHDGVAVTRRNGDKLDQHTPFMGVYWSHDGSYPLGVKYMRHEWVCENTFTPWNAETGLIIRHTRFAEDRATLALSAIEGMMLAQDAFDREVEELLQVELTRIAQPTRAVLGNKPFGKNGKPNRASTEWDKRFDAITKEWREFTAQESAFDFVQAVQGYEQHSQPVRGGGRQVKTIGRLLRDDFPMTRKAVEVVKELAVV